MCPDQRRQGPGRAVFAGLARGHGGMTKRGRIMLPQHRPRRLIDCHSQASRMLAPVPWQLAASLASWDPPHADRRGCGGAQWLVRWCVAGGLCSSGAVWRGLVPMVLPASVGEWCIR